MCNSNDEDFENDINDFIEGRIPDLSPDAPRPERYPGGHPADLHLIIARAMLCGRIHADADRALRSMCCINPEFVRSTLVGGGGDPAETDALIARLRREGEANE